MRDRRMAGVLLALALAALTGCVPAGGRDQAAADVATRLLTSVQGGDGAGACALLAPDTESAVEQSAGKPCAEAILDEDLPQPGAVTGTAVYGQWAQIRVGGDTVFLAVFPGGWRVVAAGCQSRGDRPYDCRMQGG